MFTVRRMEKSVKSSQVKAVRKAVCPCGQRLTIGPEINAASTMTALAFSSKFDFTKTYFLIAGIAGISPEVGTLGTVTFARYAIQVALQYEFDARSIPANFTTG